MTSQRVESEPLERALVEFISHARWFGGKGRPFSVTDVRVVALRDGEPRVSIALVTLSFEDGHSDLYQAPVSSYVEPQERISHALIADVDGRHVYDALHDREATQVWLEVFDRRFARRRAGPTSPTPDSPSTAPASTTWTSRRTPRSSAASRATPRWPSATTR